MNLRLRLIVAFFLLSVVPLAAVTLFTYTTSAQALWEAAGREAELLAGELSQRMNVVTAQLSERVSHLMDVAEARAEADLANSRLRAAEAPPRQTEAAPAATPGPQDAQVAQALGEMALLLNNIELRGMRGGRRGDGPPPGAPPGGAPPQRLGANGGRLAGSGRAFPGDGRDVRDSRNPRPVPGPGGPPPPPPSSPTPPTDAVPAAAPVPPSMPRPGTRDERRSPGSPPSSEPDGTPRDRILIDVGPMRRDIIRQFVPDGQWEKLTDEERRRVMGEVNQRMMGIAQGIQLGAAEAQKRIKRELELGRQIQHDMLPQAPLRLGLTEIKGVSVPAREVGGDFFNYFSLADGRIALLVGDVSGKGVGAALLMANIQASLRTRLALGQDLAALAREIDRDIEGNRPLYATLFVGILDPVTHELSFVNAGHNPQYILRRDGRDTKRLRPERGAESPSESERGWGPASVEAMTASGLPVGLLAGHGYTEARVGLATGDALFLYTDGCVEAENDAGDMFGAERLQQLLVSAAGTSDLLARVEAEITAFRGGREPFDDATMMVVKIG